MITRFAHYISRFPRYKSRFSVCRQRFPRYMRRFLVGNRLLHRGNCLLHYENYHLHRGKCHLYRENYLLHRENYHLHRGKYHLQSVFRHDIEKKIAETRPVFDDSVVIARSLKDAEAISLMNRRLPQLFGLRNDGCYLELPSHFRENGNPVSSE